MATIGRNISFPIYNGDGTSFHNLVMKRATYDSIVMSLGDKITGDVYYKDNTLVTNQDIYIVYNGVHYTLVNPPTIVREGMTSENGELKGMTKYSFEFYHPMYQLNNFPFSDIAVTSSQGKYLSQNKTFAWIGDLYDYVDKINVNLEETVWCCEIGSSVQEVDKAKLSDVLSFNNQTIADALKTGYDTWEIPYVISQLPSTDTRYSRDGKRFLITFGLPSTEIIGANNQPYVFRFGQGVGLKNNSRTPRNNKIVTRLAGYGSENNIPWGYPQIIWTGNESWNYTIDNDPTDPNSYPIYDGIVNGERVRLIKHPFTRNHLMPSIYAETVNRKVNPNAIGYDPDTVIIDYYDADDEEEFENTINPDAPSYEIHEFEDIKPELGEQYLVDVSAYDANAITLSECESMVLDYYSESNIEAEKTQLLALYNALPNTASGSGSSGVYKYDWSIANDGDYLLVKYKSSGVNFEHKVTRQVTPDWDDSIDDDGNYKQSYFKVTLPELGFDLYACAALTEKMQINMRSGDCIGCTFDVMIDWDDYKKNFYTEDGKFDPVIGTGHPRNGTKYPDSTNDEITLIVQKDNNTFGIIMPNIYQQPTSRDKFVILGISLPLAYITDAEERLDADMIQYMKDNNVFYFDYPLKFDEDFLYRNTSILAQMKPNVIVRFEYAGVVNALYIKQMSIKYGQGVLPQYDITLTDDVEIVLNKIGQVTDEVSKLRLMMGEGGDANVAELDKRYLSKRNDDTAEGMISMTKGLYVGNNFVTGLLGEGGVMRMDNDGTTYLEVDKMYVRMRAYFDTVEVRRFLHSGGNRIASLAGMKCTRVEYINSSGNVTKDASSAVKFRCYFRANDDGNVVTNDFVVGDLAFCKETNAKVGTGVEQHGYWRAVVGVSEQPNSKGEHYIDLSKSDCLSDSDIPIAQDDIIQLGNKTDTTRQGAIIEYVGGDDAPAYQIYQGINTYSLNDKNYVRFGYDSQSGGAQAYIGNPNGSTYLWYHNVTEGGVPIQRLDIKANVIFQSPTTHQDTTIENFATIVTNDIDNIQAQIDGQIESWFYDYMPVQETSGAPANRIPLTNKEPYKTWYEADNGGTASEVTTERTKHLGDTFYDNSSGYAFRFSLNTTVTPNEFEWVVIDDSAVIKALEDAANAQYTADHKRRVFLSQPAPPYDAGDLWAEGENGDLFMCTTSRQSGNYVASDWELATKYTDDTKLNNYVSDILNGVQNPETDSQIVAQALHAIKGALNEDTIIEGGLVLTSLIALRSNNTTWAGISGQYDSTKRGGGIAAWYGGGMGDWEVYKESHTSATITSDYAKSLFRFDGTGYLAGGNITWNSDGSGSVAGGNLAWNAQGQITTIAGQNISATTSITIGTGTGNNVLTQATADGRYITKAWFNKFFKIHIGNDTAGTNVLSPNTLPTDGTDYTIETLFGLWSKKFLSTLGLNSQGGGGGADIADMWDSLTGNGGEYADTKINIAHIPDLSNLTLSYGKSGAVTSSVVYNGKAGKTVFIPQKLSDLSDGNTIVTKVEWGGTSGDYANKIKVTTGTSTISAFTVGYATKAGQWNTSRNFTIKDSDQSNSGTAASVNGTAAVTLLLPSTIKATLVGNADTATKATKDGNGNNIASTYATISSLSSYVPTSTTWWGRSISNGKVDGTITINEGEIQIWNLATATSSRSKKDMRFLWSSADVFQMWAYEGTYYDLCIGTTTAGVASNKPLYFDASVARWGIGTETPDTTLDIVGTLGVSSRLYANGKITVNYADGTSSGNELIYLNVGANATYNCISYVKSSGWTNGVNWSAGTKAGGYYLWSDKSGVGQCFFVTNDGQTQVKSLKIGNIVLTDDNGLLKIWDGNTTNSTPKGIYATGTVSALGANTSGGGGTGIEMDEVWAALHTYSQATNHDIDARYLKFATTGNGNGVANVAITNGALTVTKDYFVKTVETSGDGNVLTGFILSNGTLTLTKSSITTLPYLAVNDVSGTDWTPNSGTYPEKSVTAFFTNSGMPNTNWWSGIAVKGWTNSYEVWQIATRSHSTTDTTSLYYRRGRTDTWADWRTILDSSNLSTYTYDKTATYNKNLVLASSATADGNAATFRVLEAADIPNLNASKITEGTLAIARGGTGSATTSPHFVFIGASSGTAASAPSFRALVADDLPNLGSVYKKRINANSKTTAYPDGVVTAGWYRILDITIYPKVFLITFSGSYNGARPTAVTFLVSITYNDVRINQIGSVASIGWVQELRAVTHNTSKHYIDFRYKAEGATTTTKQSEIRYEVTPLDDGGTGSISQVDFTLVTDTVTAEASCVTSSNVRADQLTTSRKLWGNNFNGTADVQGKITVDYADGTSTGNELITLKVGASATYNCISYVKSSGWTNGVNWSAGTNANGYYLWSGKSGVGNCFAVTNAGQTVVKSLKIGNIVLTDDNGMLKVWDGNTTNSTPKGIYATGTVSALGANNNSSGGGGADIADVWDSLTNSTGTSYSSTTKIHSDHIDIKIGGDGNAVTGITKSGTSITLNKGTKFLPLTAGSGNPLSGHLYISSGYGVYLNSSDALSRSSNTLQLNYGLRSTSGASTHIYGGTNGSISALIGTSAKLSIYSSQIQFSGLTFKDSISADTSGSYILTTNGAGSGEVKYITKANLKTALGVVEPVTELGTSGNYLTWTKGNDTNNITIPYATKATNDESGYSLKKYKHWSTAFTNDGTKGWYTVLSFTHNYYYRSAILHITTRRNTAVILIELFNINTPRITCLGLYGDAASASYGGLTGKIRIIKTLYDTTNKYNAIIQAEFYNATASSNTYRYCGLYADCQSQSYWTLPNSMVKDTTYADGDADILGSWTFTTNTMASNSTYPLVNATYSLGTTAMSWLGIYGRYLRATVTNGSNNYYASIVAASTFAANRTYTIPYVANGEFVMTSGDQKITGVKTFDANTLVVDGNQVSDGVNKSTIRFSTMGDNSYKNADGTAEYAQLSGLKNCIRFDWYATAWAIGNVRGGGTDSQGFAIGYMNSGKDGVLHRFLIKPNGDILTNASITAGSEVTASSDERLKTINGGTNLTIKDIASAPAIKFLWNDKRDEKVHIGSIAQYWEKALPEAVSYDGNGIMSLNYGALALVSAITIARGLMKHEDEITKLKKRVAELENELKERRAA